MRLDSRSVASIGSTWWGSLLFAMLLSPVVFLFFGWFAKLPWKGIAVLLGLGSLLMAAALVGRLRDLLLLGLFLSVPLSIDLHINYREGHKGVADGLTIECMDLWMALLAMGMVYELLHHRRVPFQLFPAFTVPGAVLVLACILSFSHSVDLEFSLYGLVDQVRTLIFLLFLANCLRSVKDLKVIHAGVMVTAILIGSICIAEVLLQSHFASGALTDKVIGEDEVFRAAGMETSTLTGGYLASLLPLLVTQFWMSRRRSFHFLVFLAFAVGFAGMFATLSRGAWVGFAAGMTALFLCLRKQVSIRVRHVSVLLVVVLLVVGFARDTIARRLDEGMNNVVARVELLHAAANMVAESPVVGIGINTYGKRMDEFAPKRKIHEFRSLVHNKYMYVWAETGTLGLLSFLMLIGITLWKCFVLLRASQPLVSVTAAGLFSALVAVMLHMNVESYDSGLPIYHFWTLVAVVAGLTGIVEGRRQRPPRTFGGQVQVGRRSCSGPNSPECRSTSGSLRSP